MKKILFSIALLMVLCATPIFAASQGQASPPVRQKATQDQPVSQVEAFSLLAGEAEKGNAQAMLTLGSFYEQGIGIPRNFIKAFQWYEKAAAAGLPEGLYNVGVCYEIGMGNTGDAEKALSFFRQAAEKGLPQAHYKLATLFSAAQGVAVDKAKAFEHLAKAAEMRYPPALNDLGLVYANGWLDQAKNPAKAFEAFADAAYAGNLDAIKNVAIAYKDGIGKKADNEAAMRWLFIAQKAGYPQDLSPLAEELKKNLTPTQVEATEKKADEWIKGYIERAQQQLAPPAQ